MREKGLDSLALAEFIFAVEDHFHVATLVDGAIAANDAKEAKEAEDVA